MATKIRKSSWNTYGMNGYTYDCANDQRSAGGVHLLQVRRGKRTWYKRICQSNGTFTAYSAATPIDDIQGEALFEQAKAY